MMAAAAVDRLPDNLHDTVAYWLTRMADYMESPSKAYLKQRKAIATECGTPGDNGTISIDPKRRAEFAERDEALLETEIELPFEPISIKDLQRAEGSKYEVEAELRPKIAPGILRALGPFLLVEDPAPETPPASKPKKS